MQISPDDTEPKSGRRVAGQDPAKRNQILDGAKRCFLDVGSVGGSDASADP